MGTIIKELSDSNINDINKCDSEFAIDNRLVPHYEHENRRIIYTVMPVPKYLKRYEPENLDFAAYIGNPEKKVYLAYIDGQVAGQIILRRNWNRFALIEDIRVDVKFRRRGIGSALLEHGETWARQNGFPGIMVETQDSNVGACQFYESYGFVLGGFDTYLYHAGTRYTEDIALFWYLVL